MKRLVSIISLCCIAAITYSQHYLGFGVAADAPFAFDNLDITQPTIGEGGEFSGIYALRYKHFLLQTGIDIGVQTPRLRLPDQSLEQPMTDTRGVPFIYRGTLASRIDKSRQLGAGVPLMIGVTGDYVYFLVGARYYYIFSSQANCTALLQTIGDYEGRYYDYFENMPNHGYHNFEPVSSNHTMTFTHDVQVMAEFGGQIPLSSGYSSRRNHVIHIALWASYSLLNITPQTESNLPITAADYSQYMQVTMTHPYSSTLGAEADVRNLCIGIKASLLFNLSGELKRKYKCNCLGVYR